MTEPSYLRMDRPQLNRRIEQAWELMRSPCRVCPRGCKVDRTQDDHRGYCGVGAKALVIGRAVARSKDGPAVILREPNNGGLIFASCNLRCVYCIAWRFSQEHQGAELSSEQLARMMLTLQEAGAVNINLNTPNMCGPQILAALPYAIDHGLRLPLIYVTSCYDSVEMLRLLDGIVDIYVAGLKYSDDATGARYSNVSDYWTVAKAALREMHRQVGIPEIEGVPPRGLIVNHMVLPNGIAGTAKAMRFIARELSADTCVCLTWSYYPLYHAGDYPDLARQTTGSEFVEAVGAARKAGLRRLPGVRKELDRIKHHPRISEVPVTPYTVSLEEADHYFTAMFFQRGLREELSRMWEEDIADGQGETDAGGRREGKATCHNQPSCHTSS